MNIEDRMSLWAAKRPREEAAELMLEGAQEIADLRRKQSLADKERSAVADAADRYAECVPEAAETAATLRSLLERMQ